MNIQTSQSLAKELSSFRASGQSTVAAFEAVLTLYSLQSRAITKDDMDELLLMAQYEPTPEIFVEVLRHKLDLSYMQVSTIHAAAPHVLKGHYYLALTGIASLKHNTELLTTYAPFSTLGSIEEVYDYLTTEVSKPESLRLLNLLNEGTLTGSARNKAITIAFVRSHLMQHLEALTKCQLKAFSPALEFQLKDNKELYRYNYKLGFLDLLRLRPLFLSGLLPKSFVELSFRTYLYQLSKFRVEGISKIQEKEISRLMEEVLELYEIIPKDQANWKEAPACFLGLYEEYLVQNNSLKTSQELLRSLIPDAPCIDLLHAALPNEVVRDLCNAVEFMPHQKDLSPSGNNKVKAEAHKAFAIPILYSSLKEGYRKVFLEQLPSVATMKFLAHPYSIPFFTTLTTEANSVGSEKYYAESRVEWEESIYFIWDTALDKHAYYLDCITVSDNYVILDEINERSFRLEHLHALHVLPNVNYLTNAIRKDNIEASVQLLTLLPKLTATDFVHLAYSNNSVRLVIYLKEYNGNNTKITEMRNLIKKMEGNEVK